MALPLSTPQSSGAMLTHLSFREFPWFNGIVLQGSRIREEVVRWVALEPVEHPEISKRLLQVSGRDCSAPRTITYLVLATSSPSRIR